MRFILILIIAITYSQCLWASMYYVNPNGLSKNQSHNFQKQLLVAHKLLPESYKKIEYINIRFKKFKKQKNKIHLAHFSRWQNEIIFSKDLIPEDGFSLNLHKTIIHELSHVYEDRVSEVHDELKFLYLSGWHKRGLLFDKTKRRNFLEQRSPDPYEFSHPRETFAVNIEYFLSQKDFKCRRPLLYEYIANKLNHYPFPEHLCEPMYQAPVIVKNQMIWSKLDPKNLYEVHYLMASKGNGVISSFGHSMIRLVFCSPNRKVKSKECLKDIEHHVVLSYRANVAEAFINYWNGLIGKYPSQLFIMTLAEVINEYNKSELRDLISYPIKLSKEELNRVVLHALGEIWTYQGKYRFITQNCATETMDFFKAIVDDEDVLESDVTTPENVYENLSEFDLIYDEFLNTKDKGRSLGLFFKSKRHVYELLFNDLKKYLAFYESLENYLNQSTADERLEIFWKIEKEDTDPSLLASMLVLEKQIYLMKSKSFFQKVTKIIVDGENVPTFVKELFKSKLNSNKESRTENLSGYGIPSVLEIEKIQSDYSNRTENFEAKKKLENWLETRFYNWFSEINKIRENIEVLNSYIIENSKGENNE